MEQVGKLRTQLEARAEVEYENQIAERAEVLDAATPEVEVGYDGLLLDAVAEFDQKLRAAECRIPGLREKLFGKKMVDFSGIVTGFTDGRERRAARPISRSDDEIVSRTGLTRRQTRQRLDNSPLYRRHRQRPTMEYTLAPDYQEHSDTTTFTSRWVMQMIYPRPDQPKNEQKRELEEGMVPIHDLNIFRRVTDKNTGKSAQELTYSLTVRRSFMSGPNNEPPIVRVNSYTDGKLDDLLVTEGKDAHEHVLALLNQSIVELS